MDTMDYNAPSADEDINESEQEQQVEQAEAEELREMRLEAPVAGSLGIADVLFPATPPVPLNARLVRGFSFHDEPKPRGLGLARSAGMFPSSWDYPGEQRGGFTK
jgi:hypothetical protein